MSAKFYYCENEYLRDFWKRWDVFFSPAFCRFFSENFEDAFFKATAIKPSQKVSLSGGKQQNDLPMYEPGSISKLNLLLWILPEYEDNISFCWKSKTGKIVKTTDEDFDENDLEYWIEGLKPAEYWKQIATEKKSHPFEIKNLPFKLTVFEWGTDMGLTIKLTGDANHISLQNAISTAIELYNKKSEENFRKDGLVHNYHFETDAEVFLLRIDTGSAGINIIKKILKELAKLNGVNEVIIDL